MSQNYRIPITAITVFGASILLALTVGIVLYLGFDQAVSSTRELRADQADTLISAMEQGLDSDLKPVREQAIWVAKDIHDLSDLAQYDEYIFGVLAATPQVAGVAIVTVDGRSRRWSRGSRKVIADVESENAEIVEWLDAVKQQQESSWREPVWLDYPGMTTLLHDTPLRGNNGEFLGVFAQVVTVAELSKFLSVNYAETGVTPFILYDRQFVLAHPMLINDQYSSEVKQEPLPTLESFGDAVLSRIWTPDVAELFISEVMVDTEASGVNWGDNFYVYLYRDIDRYGVAPWTIGAYINTTLYGGNKFRQLMNAMLVGLVVLVIAIAASIFVGHRVSTPIKAIVSAAQIVESGSLDSVPQLSGSKIRELDDASIAFNNMVKGLNERQLIRETLGRFVPEEVAHSLLAGGGRIEPQQVDATILFCDIESFTQLTESLGPVKMVDVLNTFFSAMVAILERHDGVVTQFQGDAILATFNVPITNPDHATNAIRAAEEMLACVASSDFAGEVLNVRIGVNTGSIVAGAIGAEGRLSYTVHGDAVNLAARLESLNKEYGTRLLVSEKTMKLSPDLEFSQVGESAVRGQTKSILVYTLASLGRG
jgi:class 3 adenylate cyclase